MLGCSLLAPLCVSVKMTVTQTASQRSRPLRPLRPSSPLSWQRSSPLPMTTRRTRGVAMSTKCCQIPTAPRLFTPSTCSPDYFRYIFVAATVPSVFVLLFYTLFFFKLQSMQRKFSSITHSSVRFLGEKLQRMGNQFLSSLEVMTSCSQCPTVLLDAETVRLLIKCKTRAFLFSSV